MSMPATTLSSSPPRCSEPPVPEEAKVEIKLDTKNIPDDTAVVVEVRHCKSGALVKNGKIEGLKIKGDQLVDPATSKPPVWTFEAAHQFAHFTSTVWPSLVAWNPDWYIGCTRAGLTRKTPGFTTLSK